eukprot:PLAT6962.1.p1 GENE.PLAT6962.1~~PLAT6962.1.p1  ORF type:complete len:493 (-),score=172.57 PLAT6962.1:63-1541(-)
MATDTAAGAGVAWALQRRSHVDDLWVKPDTDSASRPTPYLDRLSLSAHMPLPDDAPWRRLVRQPVPLPDLSHTGVHSKLAAPAMLSSSLTRLRDVILDRTAPLREQSSAARSAARKPAADRHRQTAGDDDYDYEEGEEDGDWSEDSAEGDYRWESGDGDDDSRGTRELDAEDNVHWAEAAADGDDLPVHGDDDDGSEQVDRGQQPPLRLSASAPLLRATDDDSRSARSLYPDRHPLASTAVRSRTARHGTARSKRRQRRRQRRAVTALSPTATLLTTLGSPSLDLAVDRSMVELRRDARRRRKRRKAARSASRTLARREAAGKKRIAKLARLRARQLSADAGDGGADGSSGDGHRHPAHSRSADDFDDEHVDKLAELPATAGAMSVAGSEVASVYTLASEGVPEEDEIFVMALSGRMPPTSRKAGRRSGRPASAISGTSSSSGAKPEPCMQCMLDFRFGSESEGGRHAHYREQLRLYGRMFMGDTARVGFDA